MKLIWRNVQKGGILHRQSKGEEALPRFGFAPVSLIFTKATNQTIILGRPPKHVLSTSILWGSLAHDKRFDRVSMRGELSANQAIAKRLAEIDNTLLTHDTALRDLYQKTRPLLLPPPEPPRRKIGFKTDV